MRKDISWVHLTVAWFVFMALVTPLGAQGRAIELEDYFRLEGVSQPAISPDGLWVAVVRTRVLKDDNRRHSEIWLVRTDGTEPPIRMTQPAFHSTSPRWSPDGTLLAFQSRRAIPGSDADATSSIWFLRMDRPGGEAFQIEGVEGLPVFSPDNQWIAYTRKTPPEAEAAPEPLPASDFEEKMHQRFEGHLFDWMAYRFDRRGYLSDPRDPQATPPEELYIVSRSGGSPRQLTRLGVDVEDAAWRPDSGVLAFTADAHQRDEHTYEKADLWTVDLEGHVQRLTEDGYHHSSPAWSPDGRSLVFRRMKGLDLVIEAKQDHGAPVDVYRMPSEGGDMVNLTSAWDLRPGTPAWRADGKLIYFNSGIGGNSHLFSVAPDGGVVRQVTTGARRQSGFSFTSDFKQMAYVATDPVQPGELFVARMDGEEEIRLTSFNDGLVSDVVLRPAERILYPSEDGTEIEGWVILPNGYHAASGKYPLVLCIHGGPHGAYGNSFSFPFQLLTAQGYVVLYTNPRGSSGYGEDFLYATWGGGWGNLDFEDVMAGVDYTLAHYRIDDKRMGVTGYSYGGFLTDWVICHTQRFRAAIAGAGISNWVSDYGTADIPRTKESEFYGPPWKPESGELLWRQSPIRYAGNVTTPTLFIHGESDFRVPIEQAEQMYTALKKQRIPAKFIRYPNSYHGGWTPWNMVHRYYHELEWWRQYLSGQEEEVTP